MVSQVLTLFTTPVVYLFFDRLRGRFASKKRSAVVVHEPHAVAGD
jgi:hypothetical protein